MTLSPLKRLSIALLAGMLAFLPAFAVTSAFSAMPTSMSEGASAACADCVAQQNHGMTAMACSVGCFASIIVPAGPQLPSPSPAAGWPHARTANPPGITSPLDPDPPNTLS
jgi:hypothetical protein